LWTLALVLAVNSTLGLYYYLRIVLAVYSNPPETAHEETTLPAVTLSGSVALAALGVLIFWLGVLPAAFFQVIRETVATFL
jgi:NADH-quinone oxidoreductase subunit N